jgi:hypothetical protein
VLILDIVHRNKSAEPKQQQVDQCRILIVWHIHPMRELLKRRSLEEHHCATAVDRCQAVPCLPSPSFRSTPCVARLRSNLWIVQQWGATWSPRHHVQQYTMPRSPACQTPAFIGETEGSSASAVQVSVHMLVATESSRQFTTQSSQPVRSELSKSYRRELRRLLLWREDLLGIFGV